MVRKMSQQEAMMRFFGLKTCDTCRKALRSLADEKVDVIDVRADGVSDADRAAILDAFGAGALNTRSTTWRGLSQDEKAQDPAVLLAAHPTLMKRPVIEKNGAWYQGWTPATRAAIGVE
jgi:arsenate reductase-like glutaredoxin family protein